MNTIELNTICNRSKYAIRTLSKPLILDVIDLLGQGELCVTEIHKRLKIEQSVASQALSKLRRLKLVKTRRYSWFIYYRLDKKRLLSYKRSIKNLAEL